MSLLQKICLGFFVVLSLAAAANYIPGLKDENGLICGIFALEWWDDLLHLGSALWALAGALISRRAARTFLIGFGALYLADGVMGLLTGVGYLDLAIFLIGPLNLPLGFKIAANAPHLALGGIALISGLFLGRDDEMAPA